MINFLVIMSLVLALMSLVLSVISLIKILNHGKLINFIIEEFIPDKYFDSIEAELGMKDEENNIDSDTQNK